MEKKVTAHSSKAFKIAYAFFTRGGVDEPTTNRSPYASLFSDPQNRHYKPATSIGQKNPRYATIPKEVQDAIALCSPGEKRSLIALMNRREKRQQEHHIALMNRLQKQRQERQQKQTEEVVLAREGTRV